jgi:acetoacetyl-CoA reductase
MMHLGGGDRADAFDDKTGLPVFEWDVADCNTCKDGVTHIGGSLRPIGILVNNARVNRDIMVVGAIFRRD